MNVDIKNCLLCACEAYKFENFYWKCSNCKLVFKDPSAFVSFETEKARYETHNNDLEDQGYLGYLDKLFSLRDHIKGEVLDYGCGPTKGLQSLIEKQSLKKFNIESYDPIFFPIEITKKYDLIFASECFEHFYKPKEEIEKVLKCLKSKGTVLISTELYDGKNFKTWWYLNDPTHVVFYSEYTFRWIADFYKLDVLFLKSPHIGLKSN